MKIMVCETCGKHIHRDERCFHCGGTGMYPAEYELEIHQAAQTVYQQMHEHLTRREFDRVLALSEQALEWMAFTGEIYWLRLLAGRECATDRELLIRGADLEHSGDYFNAIKYAGAEEHQVYLDVQEKTDALKQELRRAVERHFREEKQAMKLADTARELEKKILETQIAVTELWGKLNKTEDSIRSLEADCRMALMPHLRTLEKAQALADTLRQQVNQLKACSEEEFRGYQLRLASALQMSEEGARLVEKLKSGHPWMAEYQRLKAEQTQYVDQINGAMDQMDTYAARARALAKRLEELERDRGAVLASVAAGDFREARLRLDEQEFDGALAASGIGV